MSSIAGFASSFITFTVVLFVFLVGVLFVYLIAIYFIDRTQTEHTVRRNYPVIGRFRYIFEHLGEFFRQYFFAMDREEMPFNRAQRSWVYRAAKDIDSTVAFGSTRDLRPEGTVMFVNSAFPPLTDESLPPKPIVVGDGFCANPFTSSALVNISGMSFGAISKPAVLALSHGAKKAGCWMNTGEGGLSQYHLEGGCDIVFQIGTGKFGVRDEFGGLSEEKLKGIAGHDVVKMFEIKLSQGAKPGKGGMLPGAKVTKEIANIRGLEVGQDAISPNRHHELENNEDLLNMIQRVRRVTDKPTGFKAVISSMAWLDDLFELINRRGLDAAPDFITVDSCDGGTGAAPMSLMDDMGLPVKESLPMLIDKLNEYGLRERIKVNVSGKMINPTEVAWALCMGTDFVSTARGPMFALGCIQALQCNKNTCPTGITTHDKDLQKGLVVASKQKRVANYIKNLEKEIRIIANSCGVRRPRDLNRTHARVVVSHGRSKTLAELYPEISKD
ncbi:FMN-binding glutamate synthase family protein [Arenicella xantha]|uniref:Glutamate synthase domain-containing protein 2 n=1 Tax=Arenicella xantha TaxID=644221 RepID=A0A395JII4_9GAMM|nr:FMN-binding glutamate synthase family protein [Arenicella xantha]RBP49835.1 glutamate synthase domain-containing protein 2 [Arenicella xantha]